MLAIDLISEIVPAVKKDDKTLEALNWMDVFKVSHLPVVDGKQYIGLISDSDIFDLNNPDSYVTDGTLMLPRPFVKDNQHIYEVIYQVAKYKITVIPVLDQNEAYLGVITLNDLAQEVTHLMSAENPGAIIVLELKENDYSLSEIAQIIEGNDAKILSLYVRTMPAQNTISITIKLNIASPGAVIQTFERYSYKIVSVFASSADLDYLLQDRLDSFFKYLSI